MDKEFMRFVQGEKTEVPQTCVNSIRKHFKKAKDVQWQPIANGFEAIFYKDNLEFIALFRTDGSLVEYRKTVPEGYLPFAIRQLILKKGEVMNRLMVNRGNEIFYEVIYRDKELNRFMILINDTGTIVKEKKL